MGNVATLINKRICWLTHEEITQIDINSLDNETNIGYILEVDMNYPRSLHDHHNAYPFAPEHLTIDESMLSLFRTERFHKNQKTPPIKLTPNL